MAMFPEFRDLIARLKNDNAHFVELYHRHDELDRKIRHLELDYAPDGEIEVLKKEKLHLKDEIYQILLHHSAEELIDSR